MNLSISKKALYPLTLLIIPLLGVLITDSVEWGIFDFIFNFYKFKERNLIFFYDYR